MARSTTFLLPSFALRSSCWGFCTPWGLLAESSWLLARVDDQGITHRRLLRKHFMARGSAKAAVTQLDESATRVKISILSHGEDDCLHFECLAEELREALLLVVACKRDIVCCKQPQQGLQRFTLCSSQLHVITDAALVTLFCI